MQIICLAVHRDRLLDLQLNLEVAFSEDLEDPELQPILLSPLLKYYRPSLVFSFVAYTLFVSYAMAPIIVIVLQLIHGATGIKYILPFTTAYPWSIAPTNKWFFLMLYIYEIYIDACMTSVAASVDALFGYYIFHISGQLRTVSYRLNNLKMNDDYQRIIKTCVKKHQILIGCRAHLEQIYGPIVLFLSVSNAFIICAMIWQATHVSNFSLHETHCIFSILTAPSVLRRWS